MLFIFIFRFHWPNPSKDSHGSNRVYSCSSKVANSTLVQHFSGNVVPGTIFGDPHKENLILTQKTDELHPLWSKQTLLIGKVSGKYFYVKALIMILLTFWWQAGEKTLSPTTVYTWVNGLNLHLATRFHRLNRQLRLH